MYFGYLKDISSNYNKLISKKQGGKSLSSPEGFGFFFEKQGGKFLSSPEGFGFFFEKQGGIEILWESMLLLVLQAVSVRKLKNC
jgi:hypothetical protein